ncbi:hypothetical protein SERLA73DRAFT_188732 [Serpula lacrymans var. lacrymans S7.3]|uniref:PCI domain-containing protein n=2 Tax=Serpula lacrymans var. lacrymans TaxID=341189 RepID=F8QC26_SERL3|nr:uncharacterized protein SERLADRAFT_479136 [Serpula lacrymans var. lacrymans S7.9]EGN94145.1 hypothetical protein SERLA73DRAFT_188732 [Serpula lacrymans var. lacrymans S7.3]EGO19573.1 hypothetical protein SERLADRAFT_479136 [Serpula lacrymans var. lacrymans S7.9]
MELGSNFSAKLEPFLLMSKSAKGAAAAKLVQDATSAPGVFVFAELLELPNIQELTNSEQHAPYISLLQLFSYNTYQDYLKHKDNLPPLNQAQITKLKYLSIVSLAAERRILPYSQLLETLQMPTIRELEDLIIDAIYLDLLRGKLDQKEQQLEVEYTMGRDVEPGKIESILSALQSWAATTSAVLSTLDQKLEYISSHSEAVHAENEEHERALASNLKDVFDRQKDSKGPKRAPGTSSLAGGLGDSMDVDDPVAESTKLKNRKAPTESAIKRHGKRNRF